MMSKWRCSPQLAKRVIHLRFTEGLSYTMISDRLGCSKEWARTICVAETKRRIQGDEIEPVDNV
jgi:hypothetical protein